MDYIMKNYSKVFGLILSFALLSLLFIYNAQSQDGLIEDSIASGKQNTPSRDMNQLFDQLGISKLSRSANPCIDAEEYTRKWCSFHGIKISSKELALNLKEKKFLKEILTTKLPCETLAQHIGRTCEQENLMQIIQHFSRSK